MKETKELIMQVVFLLTACMSILAVILICVFMFANGLPAIVEIGPLKFLLGQKWKPNNNIFGILPMIIGSIYVTVGAIVIGVPIGFFAAVYLAKFCSPKVYRFVKPAVELMAGIPSIVYGFFGLVVIVPLMQKTFGGNGKSVLTASILLGIMILPTIINITETTLKAVPNDYREASYGLGATKIQTIFKVVIPAGKSGIASGIVLGVGRAIGEAMAIIMVAGNAVNMPLPFNSVRFLTTGIVSEFSYSSGLHREALFGIGLVLFVFIMIINIVLNRILKSGGESNEK